MARFNSTQYVDDETGAILPEYDASGRSAPEESRLVDQDATARAQQRPRLDMIFLYF